MDDYTKKIIYHLNSPKYNVPIENCNLVFESKSPLCGDFNRLHLKLENNKIESAFYENSGCGLNTVVLEIICELLIGKEKEEIRNIVNIERISSELNFPKGKTHCIELVLSMFKNI